MKPLDLSRADLLDILFEHRNKEYGAYALRRNYNNRLWVALGGGLGFLALLVAFTAGGTKTNKTVASIHNDKEVVLRTMEIPPVQKPEQPVQKPAVKPVLKQVKYTSVVKIVKDRDLPEPDHTKIADLDSAIVSTQNVNGLKTDPDIHIPLQPVKPETGGNGLTDVQPDFNAVEHEPEFPGGPQALQRYLSRNLSSPEGLAAGETRTVQVQFTVEKDGHVSNLKVLLSAGDEFDKEVVRVCRTMPRWIPAEQNGVHVPVGYQLPVTFVGIEQ